MAANLNPPSDFVSTGGPRQSMKLLPPSTFEKPHVEDPWKALGQATSEILDLRQQNQQLSMTRNITLPAGEEIKARVNVHHASGSHPPAYPSQNTMPFETLIQRQAEEIIALKKQTSQSESLSQKQISRLESQLLIKDSQHAQEVALLKSELDRIRGMFESNKITIEASTIKVKEDNEMHVTNLKQQLEALESQRQLEISGLKQQLAEVQCQADEEMEKVCKQRTKLEDMLGTQNQSLKQMKTYLQESEQSFKSTEIWRKETSNLQKDLKTLKEENTQLKSELELSNIRFKSLNEILAIQEQEMSQQELLSQQESKLCLLSRWRTKVFELMMEVKCSDISLKSSNREWSNKLQECKSSLCKVSAQCKILQHSLQEKQAHLEIEQQQVQKLKRDVQQADEVALKLDAERKQAEAYMQQLYTSADNVYAQYCKMEQSFSNVCATLNSYNQKIAFASGRVEMLQSQFARREALIKVQVHELVQEKPTRDHDVESEKEGELDTCIHQQLVCELERVTTERDRLASQVKADSEMMEHKLISAKQQTIDEMEEIKARLQELHSALEEKNKECSDIYKELDGTKTDLEKNKLDLESLKQVLEETHSKAEKDIQNARVELENKLLETVTEMEDRVNEARREHTKDIIKVRQMERQHQRDKERATKHLEMTEKHYKDQLEKTEKKLRSIEKDRNILLNTVKQEGLIAKYQRQRPKPAQLEEDSDDTQCAVDQQGAHAIPSSFDDSQKSEPLHEVIDDLKKLTAIVLDDEMES